MMYMSHNNKRRLPVMRRRRKSPGLRFNMSSSSLVGLLVFVFCLLVFMWPNPAPKKQSHLRKALLLEETNIKNHLTPPRPSISKSKGTTGGKQKLSHGKLKRVSTKDLISEARRFSEKLTTGEEILNAMIMMEQAAADAKEETDNVVENVQNPVEEENKQSDTQEEITNDVFASVEEREQVTEVHEVVKGSKALSEQRKAQAFEEIAKVLLERYQKIKSEEDKTGNSKKDDSLVSIMEGKLKLSLSDDDARAVRDASLDHDYMLEQQKREQQEEERRNYVRNVDGGPDPNDGIYKLMDQLAQI